MRYAEKSTVASWRAVAASRWPLTACASATFSPRKRVSAPAEWLGSSKKPISCLTSERAASARRLRVRCSPTVPKIPSSIVMIGTYEAPTRSAALPQKTVSSCTRSGSILKREVAVLVKMKPSAGIVMPSSTANTSPTSISRPSPRSCSRISCHQSGLQSRSAPGWSAAVPRSGPTHEKNSDLVSRSVALEPSGGVFRASLTLASTAFAAAAKFSLRQLDGLEGGAVDGSPKRCRRPTTSEAPGPCTFGANGFSACLLTSERKRPPSMSSSWSHVPCSTTRPPSMTAILSELRMVLSRCAIVSVVRFCWCMISSIAACTTRSLVVSSADVASSSSRMAGLRTMARAMAIRCFWPPESVPPRRPTLLL
mmetsp:Transcript_19986/g.59032  ORF Transcript_19986/g.59032 Transcript_19986/m.59032 type:complete len:367 (-) Transcript_19986:144-1244(-)